MVLVVEDLRRSLMMINAFRNDSEKKKTKRNEPSLIKRFAVKSSRETYFRNSTCCKSIVGFK